MPSIPDSDVGKLPERAWLDSPVVLQSPVPSFDVTSHPSPRHMAPTSKKYQCPMCFLDNNPVGFGRKSDFKKHLYNFHGADIVWICRTKGCHLTFATERAYSTHSKETHRMDALPNSSARTELCPQVVFACGFSSCKDRVFEAQTSSDASNSRDKFFEHIAKHFEDGFDVNDWEYRIQIQNLMRQERVKPTWKTCIWPKEKRQQMWWRPRSSGDLKRMLECRHLGEDVSTLVRLAFILGTSPFTSPSTPPPSEIDLHFQLPFRNECLMDTVGHSETSQVKNEDTPMVTVSKQRPDTAQSSSTPFRRIKQESRPSTAAGGLVEPMIRDDLTAGPHPGTPFPIPNETNWPNDAPKFAPDNALGLPEGMMGPDPTTMGFPMPGHDATQQPWANMNHMQQFQQHQPDMMNVVYTSMPTSAPSSHASRPATPNPSKRPGSWGKRLSLENLRPKKKTSVYGGSPAGSEPIEAVPPVPAMYAMSNVAPTSMPAGYDLPMRFTTGYMPQTPGHQHQQQPMGSPGSFYLGDDGEMRL